VSAGPQAAKYMNQKAMETLETAGASQPWFFPVDEQNLGYHLLGTCRMAAMRRRQWWIPTTAHMTCLTSFYAMDRAL